MEIECLSCEEMEAGSEAIEKCSVSQRSCGHHCNHFLTDDYCCWCGDLNCVP